MEPSLFLAALTWALVANVLPVIGAPAALCFAVLCPSSLVVLAALVEAAPPSWLGRRRLMLGALALVFASLAGWAGPLRHGTAEGVLRFWSSGEHGPTVFLVYRMRDLAPRLVVFVEGDPDRSQRRSAPRWFPRVSWSTTWSSSPPDEAPDTDVNVDVGRGVVRAYGEVHSIPVAATVVHVQRGSVVASAIALGPPSSALRELVDGESIALLSDLARCFAGPTDPVLRGALTGQTSTRCFDVVAGDDERLVAKVDRGRVLSVCLPSVGTRSCFRCGPCVVARDAPGRLVRTQRWNGDVTTEADLPTFAQLHEALTAIEGGASIADATATWPQAR